MGDQTRRLSPVEKAPRIFLYDNAKFLAILLVVIGHDIDIITEQSAEPYFTNALFTAIYGVHMPLFIFISGLFTKPMNRETKFPTYKVLSFFLIAIVLRIAISLERLFLRGRAGYSILNMYDSFTWYLGAVAVFLVIVWIFRTFNKWAVLGIAFAVGCMAGYDSHLGDAFSLLRIAVFLPFFLLGYCFEPDKLLGIFQSKWFRLLGAALLIAYLVLCFTNPDFVINFRRLFTGRNRYTIFGPAAMWGGLLRMLAYAISLLAGFSVLAVLPNRNLGVITKTGTKTLQIYFWHRLMLYPLEVYGVYLLFEQGMGVVWAHILYILIAPAVTALCAIPIFSFPTKQILMIGRKKPDSPPTES